MKLQIEKAEGRTGLALLDFPVAAQPIFNQAGNELKGYQAVIRPDTEAVLGVVRSRYELVTHRQALDPFVEKLTSEGWMVHKVQVERAGAKAYVELINKEYMKPVKKDDLCGMRLTIRNSYDGSSAISAQMGAFRLVCTNGLTAPTGPQSSSSFRHLSNVFDRMDEAGREYAASFDAMLDIYRGLADTLVPNEIAQKMLKEVVGARRLDLVKGFWLNGTGSDGQPTAWNLYNAVTEYLSHSFEGAVETRDMKSRQMLDRLLKRN